MANLVSRAGKKFIRTARRVQKRLSPRGHILMYHSIGDSEMDPWSMQVNPPHFEEHLEVIKRIARPVSIAQLASMQKEGRVEPNSVAITFDDGYVNNYTVAKPLLEKHELHAMVYAVPGFVRTGKPFWWDQLQAVLLKPGKLPGELKLTVSGKDKYWNLGEAVDYSYEQAREDHHQHPWSAKAGTRLGFYFSVWNTLFQEHPSQHDQLVEEIKVWAGDDEIPFSEETLPMTLEQLADLSDGGLIGVGGHTANHTNLAALSAEMQKNEILEGKRDLEAITGNPVTGFAYPFGQFNSTTVSLLEGFGFQHACTIQQESVWSGNTVLQLPRWEVRDCDGETFEKKLRDWFTK